MSREAKLNPHPRNQYFFALFAFFAVSFSVIPRQYPFPEPTTHPTLHIENRTLDRVTLILEEHFFLIAICVVRDGLFGAYWLLSPFETVLIPRSLVFFNREKREKTRKLFFGLYRMFQAFW